jgi:hypothetical protein
MIVQEEWVSINTTPDVVERHLTDKSLFARWRSPLVQFEPVEGELMALGSVHKMRLVSLALAGAVYTVSERDREHILLRIDGLWRGTDRWRWFSDGTRTVVQNRVEYEVPDPTMRVFVVGLGQLFASLDMRLQMTRLRQIIEEPTRPAIAGQPARQIGTDQK